MTATVKRDFTDKEYYGSKIHNFQKGDILADVREVPTVYVTVCRHCGKAHRTFVFFEIDMRAAGYGVQQYGVKRCLVNISKE
jgi:hypothetical protein